MNRGTIEKICAESATLAEGEFLELGQLFPSDLDLALLRRALAPGCELLQRDKIYIITRTPCNPGS
jgi:hypothetical protein